MPLTPEFLELRRGARSFSFIGLILGWRIFGYLYDPIFSAALRALYPGAGYE